MTQTLRLYLPWSVHHKSFVSMWALCCVPLCASTIKFQVQAEAKPQITKALTLTFLSDEISIKNKIVIEKVVPIMVRKRILITTTMWLLLNVVTILNQWALCKLSYSLILSNKKDVRFVCGLLCYSTKILS